MNIKSFHASKFGNGVRHAGDRFPARPMGEIIDHACTGFIVDFFEEAGWLSYVPSVITPRGSTIEPGTVALPGSPSQ